MVKYLNLNLFFFYPILKKTINVSFASKQGGSFTITDTYIPKKFICLRETIFVMLDFSS